VPNNRQSSYDADAGKGLAKAGFGERRIAFRHEHVPAGALVAL
jgi:hypothetical protein